MSTDTKQDLYLVVSEERRNGYFHLRARISTDRYDNGQRWPYGLDDRYNGPLYSGLCTACQGDMGTQLAESPELGVYGFGRLEYRDEYSVDLARAERMVKTIKTLERGLAKLEETRGRVRSYSEYVGRLAEVLKCKGIAIERRKDNADMTGQKWEWFPIGEGIRAIHNRIWSWQREVQRQAVSA